MWPVFLHDFAAEGSDGFAGRRSARELQPIFEASLRCLAYARPRAMGGPRDLREGS